MLNMIWLLLLVSGILVAAWHGNIEVVTTAALQAARDAVEVCLNLVGIMALWLGIMKIAESGGMVSVLARMLRPLMVRLFPVCRLIILLWGYHFELERQYAGFGQWATPFGMKAMQHLQEINPRPNTA